jgi:uncharacterized protein with LGFP repeats
VRLLTEAQFRANVEWFIQQSRGRPVTWLDIHDPYYPEQVARFNAVLRDAAARWQNLRILDWRGHVAAHPHVLATDGVHIRDFDGGCRDGRLRLIQEAAPSVAGDPAFDGPGTEPPVVVPVPSPIAAKLGEIGDTAGLLGTPAAAEVCGFRSGGCRQEFTRGAVYWSAATGAHVLSRAGTSAKWRSEFGEMGSLGYPTEDTQCIPRNGGCRQQFETGSVYWSPDAGAHFTIGPIRDRWTGMGAENGALRYPTTDTVCGMKDNGCYQFFQGGVLYWSIATGPQPVFGSIYHRWQAGGWERGFLGYPTSTEACGLRGGGCYQFFQGGAIYWSPTTGAQVVKGAVYDRWASKGWERGSLGYPTGNEVCGLRGGGCYQFFQGGAIYWSPATGAHAVSGRIYDRWAAQGWERGRLGYPATEEFGTPGGTAQRFQGGMLP